MSYPYQIRTKEDYEKAFKKSVDDPEAFWSEVAADFYWRKKWDKTLDWNFTEPSVQWFRNGKLNITENCLDRHLDKLANTPAIIWEPNDPEEHHRVLSYKILFDKVCQFTHVLKNNGV